MQEQSKISNSKENSDYDKLFYQYIDVCNKAITKHKNTFPYKEIWGAGFRPFMKGYQHGFTIYDNRPKGVYSLGMTQDAKLKPELNVNHNPKKSWPLNYSYLKHVIDNAEEHIENPAKLDWSWLKDSGK